MLGTGRYGFCRILSVCCADRFVCRGIFERQKRCRNLFAFYEISSQVEKTTFSLNRRRSRFFVGQGLALRGIKICILADLYLGGE